MGAQGKIHAYRLGRWARHLGKPRSACPYSPEDCPANAAEWRAGWDGLDADIAAGFTVYVKDPHGMGYGREGR